MATKTNEIEILLTGMQSTDDKSGPEWIQNMWIPNKTLEVRPGWGQVANIDSTLSLINNPLQDIGFSIRTDYGFQKVLGSTIFRTPSGARQILTVLQTIAVTSDCDASPQIEDVASKAHVVKGFEAVVYDLETDNIWHYPIIHRTNQERPDARPAKFAKGVYETDADFDRQRFIGGATDDTVSFTMIDNKIFFGSPSLPLHCYVPSSYRPRRFEKSKSKQANIVSFPNDSSEPFSESATFARIVPVKNPVLQDAFEYLTEGDLPNPAAITEYQNSLVVARGREIFFSDFDLRNAFKAANFITIQSDFEITAVHGVGSYLYIFTEGETFIYQAPATGALLSGGEAIRISETIGCYGPLAKTTIGTLMIWGDRSGIHTANGAQINTISDPIKHLFEGGMSNPYNNYTTQSGYLTFSNEQPRTFFEAANAEPKASMAHDDDTQSIFFSMPSLNLTVVFKIGTGFFVWNYEDVLDPQSKVKATRNLPNMQVLSIDGTIFAVGGLQEEEFLDSTDIRNGATGNNNDGQTAQSNSYFICQLGRGGALDRSVKNEDERTVLGRQYILEEGAPTQGQFYIEKPEFDPDGNLVLRVAARCAPTNMVTAQADQVDFLQVSFRYDTSHWQPVLSGTSATDLDFLLEPERQALRDGWHVFKSAFAAPTTPNAAGEHICIEYDGSKTVVAANNTSPYLNMTTKNRNTLCAFKLAPKSGVSSFDTNNYGLAHTSNDVALMKLNSVSGSATNLNDCHLIAWQQAVRSDLAGGLSGSLVGVVDTYTQVSQSINWLYKGSEIGDGNQIRARGLYSKMGTHGRAATSDSWPWGLLNAQFEADRKEYSGQIIDNSSQANNTFALTTVPDKDALRDRLYDSTAGIMAERVFSGSATYGSTTSSGTGNFLIDESQIDTISMSQSTRGEHVSVTLFGFIRDKAEKMFISSVKFCFRYVAGKRRRGR